jgi:hypothetical protein
VSCTANQDTNQCRITPRQHGLGKVRADRAAGSDTEAADGILKDSLTRRVECSLPFIKVKAPGHVLAEAANIYELQRLWAQACALEN